MLKTFLSFIVLTFACTACGEPPITDGGVTFNQTAADKLTPEQYKKMDIEFFNYFDVRHGFGANQQEQIKERTDRVIRLAEAGYEPAWLALRLYSYRTGGQTHFRDDYPVYWKKLKALADSGNASAQCFFPLVVDEFESALKWKRERGIQLDELPTQETQEIRWAYLQAAAKQGHTYCQNYAAGAAREEGDLKKVREIKRNCALAGDARCESSMGLHYSMQEDVASVNGVKSLCWYLRAYEHNHATRALSNIDSAKIAVSKAYGDKKMDAFIAQFNLNMDCDAAKIE